MHLSSGIHPFVVRTQATSLKYRQSPNTLPVIPPKRNNFSCDKMSKKKFYSICASKMLSLWIKETTYWPTLGEVLPADQGNTLSLWTQHWWGHTWNTASSIGPCCSRGSCEDNRARLFLVVATRGNSHKLWLEISRWTSGKFLHPEGSAALEQCAGRWWDFNSCTFSTTAISTNFHDSKGTAQKSHGLCSHPHLTYCSCCFPLPWGSILFLLF